MNDLQKKELEILAVFIDICEKLNLTYYLVCGSALGAVKYGGFIPWDDDVDVALPRQDYEKFLEVAPQMLPEHLFLQNYRTDPAFPRIFSKIRDSRTTYIEDGYQFLNIHHGVFIDVFALDGYPSDVKTAAVFEKKKKKYLRLTSCALLPSGSEKSRVLRRVLRVIGCHKKTAKYLAEYEEMLRSHEHTDVFCNYGNFRGAMEKTPKMVYGTGCDALFENLRVRIPSDYNNYLRVKYGDYVKDPPVEEQVGHHFCTVMDLSQPYTVYSERNRK